MATNLGPDKARARLGVGSFVLGVLLVLGWLQDIPFAEKLLSDIGVTPILKVLFPTWVGVIVTLLFLCVFIAWLAEPLLKPHLDKFAEEVHTWRDSRKTLRAHAYLMAKRMRAFADKLEREGADSKDAILTAFWAKFPYKDYGAIHDRMTVTRGFQVQSFTDALPSSISEIRRLAGIIEREGHQTDADILL